MRPTTERALPPSRADRVSYWLDSIEGLDLPTLVGNETVDVVIVGGGIYLVRTATSGAARLGGLGLLVAGAAALASFAMRMALGV